MKSGWPTTPKLARLGLSIYSALVHAELEGHFATGDQDKNHMWVSATLRTHGRFKVGCDSRNGRSSPYLEIYTRVSFAP